MNSRKKTSEYKAQHMFPIPSKKQAKGSSPVRDSQQQPKTTFLSDNLINFDINCYPFLNQECKTRRTYRSTVNLKVSSEQLRKLMRLNHPNLINVQKITRGHGKEPSLTHQHEIYYSFYYDEVPFSLKYVAMYQDNSNTILKKINQINLNKILASVNDYLQRAGVTYLFNLADIGVTREGEIKVYLSPIHFCTDKESNDKGQTAVSIDKITAWWQTTLASNTTLNPKSSNIILPSQIGLEDEASIDYLSKDHQQSFIDKEASQLMGEEYDQSREYNEYRHSNAKQSMVKNQTLKNSNNSMKSQLSKISSSQMNKMKKIDQEIKYIRERLKDKRRQHKESDSFLDKKDKIADKFRRQGNIMAESDRIQKKDVKQDKSKAEGAVIQKIQQNINCINIYTHPRQGVNQKVSHTKIKKMTSQPIYSFQITPQLAKQKSKPAQVIVHHPSFEPQDFPNSESASSVDTYEMQLEAEIEPAKAVQRNSALTSERQISQKNYRPSYQNQHVNEKKNQVVNKHVTESAGPLQFKNFVNKYIKPQFLAKKSNIYQDPMEYESETSKSISKKKKIIADLYENGKSVNSQTQKSSSLNRNTQEIDCKKKDSFLLAKSNQDAFIKNSYNRTNSEIKLLPVRDISNEKNEAEQIRKSKKGNDSKIGQRIKLVLEKTKNAIALLNRVKNCRSPPVAQQKIQNSSHYY